MHSIPDIDEPFQLLEDASDISYCKFLKGDLPLVTHTQRERDSIWLFQHGVEGLASLNPPDLLESSLKSVLRSRYLCEPSSVSYLHLSPSGTAGTEAGQGQAMKSAMT